MNDISFKTQRSEFGDTIVPIIDGRSLISILRDVELPYGASEGSPSIAGAYGGLIKSYVQSHPDYLFGNKVDREGKTVILDCNCSCLGCWSFVVAIKINDREVRWENFEQVHRRNWKYVEIEPFVFDRDQYESAIVAIA